MATAQKKLKTADKWKKKKWFSLIAPRLFQERVIGETPAYDPESVMKRTVSVSLMTLTSNIKRQNVNIVFEVEKVQGDHAFTRVKTVELVPASIKRKVGRGHDRLDDSFVCVTKDGVKVRIKPLIVANSKSSNILKASMRKLIVNGTKRTVATITYEMLINDIVNIKLQKALKNVLHKMTPVRSVDIRLMQRLGEALLSN